MNLTTLLALTPLLAATMCACTARADDNFTLSCPAPADADNTMAYLVDCDNGLHTDSVIVNGGAAHFTGHTVTPYWGRVYIGGQRGPVVMVEPGRITVDSLGVAAGTPLNDRHASYLKRLRQIRDRFATLDQSDTLQALEARKLTAEYDAMPQRAYAENRSNPVGLYWYMQDGVDYPLTRLEADMKANPYLASSAAVKALCATKRTQAQTAPGTKYKDFTISYEGRTDSLSAYVTPGRYTIVDYWASWCGPCRKQLPVIKALYERYHAKGLDAVGVAVWDKPEDTLAALAAHGINWPCMLNAQAIPTDLYGIEGIPCIMLIGPDGTIVARGLMGERLTEAVDKAMDGFKLPEPAKPATEAVPDTIPAF